MGAPLIHEHEHVCITLSRCSMYCSSPKPVSRTRISEGSVLHYEYESDYYITKNKAELSVGMPVPLTVEDYSPDLDIRPGNR